MQTSLSRIVIAAVRHTTSLTRQLHFSPMHRKLQPLLMASLSPTMQTGNIIAWNYKEGDEIEAGNAICEIETDKAVVGLDHVDDVVLVKITKPEGSQSVPLGQLIGWVVDKGDDITNLEIPDHYEHPCGDTTTTTPTRSCSHSGAENPIVAKPAQRIETTFTSSLDSPGDIVNIPISSVRGIVASRLSLSKRTIPHEYSSMNCAMDRLVKLRFDMKSNGQKVSINDFIVKAVSLSLALVREMNGVFENDKLQLKDSIDVAVAVSIPEGLITPVIRNADKIPIGELSQMIKDLARRAKKRKLLPMEFQNSSFTVSNLGMFGVDEFSAVINPPEVGILAIGGTRNVLNPDLSKQMTVNLSYDRRAINPEVATRFLKYFKGFIENPSIIV